MKISSMKIGQKVTVKAQKVEPDFEALQKDYLEKVLKPSAGKFGFKLLKVEVHNDSMTDRPMPEYILSFNDHKFALPWFQVARVTKEQTLDIPLCQKELSLIFKYMDSIVTMVDDLAENYGPSVFHSDLFAKIKDIVKSSSVSGILYLIASSMLEYKKIRVSGATVKAQVNPEYKKEHPYLFPLDLKETFDKMLKGSKLENIFGDGRGSKVRIALNGPKGKYSIWLSHDNTWDID